MLRPEYIKIHIKIIPQKIIDKYKVIPKVKDRYINVKFIKGMYCSPQAILISNKIINKRPYQYGFKPTKSTPGIWTHEKKSIQFTLVVYDSGIQYNNKEDVEYQIKVLLAHYVSVSEDWNGELF